MYLVSFFKCFGGRVLGYILLQLVGNGIVSLLEVRSCLPKWTEITDSSKKVTSWRIINKAVHFREITFCSLNSTQEAYRPPRSARYAALSPDEGGEGGTPSSPGEGWYSIQSWMRGVPHPVLYGGTPWDVVPPSWTWEGGTPPPRRCEQTDTCENSTFPRTTYPGGNQMLGIMFWVSRIAVSAHVSEGITFFYFLHC